MNIVRLTKEFSFEMAHALMGYDGICREIHGHSYRLFVTVSGIPNDDPADPKFGMVMDFGALKKIVNDQIVNVYDHSLIFRRTERNTGLGEILSAEFEKVKIVDFQPTCENLILLFKDILMEALRGGNVELAALRLHETATSYAEWVKTDNLR